MQVDNELFELCKEVYEKTGWEDETLHAIRKDGMTYDDMAWLTSNNYFPLYTSDYLFEQIERRIGKYKVLHVYSMFDVDTYEKYCKANVGTPGTIEIQTDRTDTPRKALLKLTLALKKAKEL